jgi:hypothetical protein
VGLVGPLSSESAQRTGRKDSNIFNVGCSNVRSLPLPVRLSGDWSGQDRRVVKVVIRIAATIMMMCTTNCVEV